MSNNRFAASMMVLALPATAALLFVSACSRSDQAQTAANKSETVAVQTQTQTQKERAPGTLGQETREAGREVAQAAEVAADTVTNKARDGVITAEVNAKLAQDDRLSALDINVDTFGGQVILRGNAPDTAARARASELAAAVKGVVNVSNQLNVQPAK
jgi:hyperosmotically inducible periplasmic protein